MVTGGLPLTDGYALGRVSVGTRVNEGYFQVETLLVDMLSGLLIVKSIYHYVERAEEAEAKPVLLDAAHKCSDSDVLILEHDLIPHHLCLRFVYVLPPEEELAIEVAHINCVKVDLHTDLDKATEIVYLQ